jgi:hypothetical protein
MVGLHRKGLRWWPTKRDVKELTRKLPRKGATEAETHSLEDRLLPAPPSALRETGRAYRCISALDFANGSPTLSTFEGPASWRKQHPTHTTPSCGSALQPCNDLHVTLPYPSPVAPLHCAVLCRHHEYIITWSACWPAFNRNQPGSFIQRRAHLSFVSHGRALAQ